MKEKSYIKIIESIDRLLKKDKILIIAIDGNSGSGKSTLASYLSANYDCNIFHMDNFFLRPEQKTTERLQEIGGNIDYLRFKDEVLTNIKENSEFVYQIYDCSLEALTEYIKVFPKKLNIVEGVYSIHPLLEPFYDFKIFLISDATIQVKRILSRSNEIMLKRFVGEWIPLENEYFEKLDIAKKCDLVIRTDE